jgi:hypothetical protein
MGAFDCTGGTGGSPPPNDGFRFTQGQRFIGRRAVELRAIVSQ